LAEPQTPSATSLSELPLGRLRFVRLIILATAAVWVTLIAVDLGDNLAGLAILALLVPLPCYLAFGLLWRDDHRSRLLAGLSLSRVIGFLHAPLFFLMALDDLFGAGSVRYAIDVLLFALFGLQLSLIWLTWSMLMRLRQVPQGDVRPGGERFLKVLGVSILALYGLSYLMTPLANHSHALPRRESAAIGELRTLSSAQAAYSNSNEGFFGSLECLKRPADCIPDSTKAGPVFLHEAFPETSRGYSFTFRIGRTLTPAEIQKTRIAPGSFSTWAFYAVPETPGRSGVRSFCIDQSGVLFQTTDGSLPDTSQPVCPSSMTILR
jgi:hypothetical protein